MDSKLIRDILEAGEAGEDIYALTERLDRELNALAEGSGDIKGMMADTEAKIKEVQPDKNKMVTIASNFLNAVKKKMIEAGRFAKEQIKSMLQNYVDWLRQVTGLDGLRMNVAV